jgi:hypothetical protein
MYRRPLIRATPWVIAAIALGIRTSGCAAPVTHYSDPSAFAQAVFRVANAGDESQWGLLLTRARREQGHPYVHSHFAKYQKLMLELEEGPLGGDAPNGNYRVDDGALEFEHEGKWVTIFRVEMEDGGWKINQD